MSISMAVDFLLMCVGMAIFGGAIVAVIASARALVLPIDRAAIADIRDIGLIDDVILVSIGCRVRLYRDVMVVEGGHLTARLDYGRLQVSAARWLDKPTVLIQTSQQEVLSSVRLFSGAATDRHVSTIKRVQEEALARQT